MMRSAAVDTRQAACCHRDAISYHVQRTSQIASATFLHDDPESFHAR